MLAKNRRITRAWLLLVGVLLIFPLESWGNESEVPAYVTEWLSSHVVVLETTDPTIPTNDTEPLRTIFGNARIVGLGEQTHGTKEFFDMKHRVLRFLVQEMGFTIFAMEADWVAARKVDDYILGKSSMPPATLIKQLGYWTWSTEEVLAMVRWMRDYNDGRGDAPPIRFVGVDIIPQTVEGAGALFLDYLSSVNAAVLDVAIAAWEQFEQAHGSMMEALPSSSAPLELCESSLRALESILEENRDAYIASSSVDAFAHAAHALTVASWHSQRISQMGAEHSAAAANIRDLYMAENTRWWLEQFGEDAKMVLWAHNFHVGRDPSPIAGWISSGYHLAQMYGDEYLPVALSFAYGQFTAISKKLGTCNTPAFEPDSYEAAFESTAFTHFILDLRELEPETETWKWMTQARPFRDIGTLCSEQSGEWSGGPNSLPQLFDAVIYIEQSTPAVQLRR
ncbi:erythromycin esterase family protein [Candidatus Bipolaricaulota bacterium]|nr:erythromycin esterase family protein [Candidatus Bipolaricaulota bacterium]